MKFICPDCGHTKLAEIQIHATVTSLIKEIPEIEFDITYEHVEVQDGRVERYQCYNCGFVIRNTINPVLSGQPIDEFDDLVLWLDANVEQGEV